MWIAWRLFFVEYDAATGSLAGIYIGLARGIAHHGLHLDWWPLWYCGMPFQNVYQPGFHLTVAAVSKFLALTPARAYHIVVGWTYCLGPVTLFVLTVRLTRSVGTAAIAGLIYSLTSPASWLSSAVRLDNGGPFRANRLHALVTYADAPQNAGLVLVPLAILALDYVLVRRTTASHLLAVAAICAVPLVNIPASIVLAIAIVAYLLASPAEGTARRVATVLTMGSAAYSLIGPMLPPSTIRTVLSNAWQADAAGIVSAWNTPLLLAAGVAAILLRYIGGRFAWPLSMRFFLLFAFFTSFIVLPNLWFDLTFLAQPRRFQLAMEMAIVGAAATGGHWLLRRWNRVRLTAATLVVLLCALEIPMYRNAARGEILPIDMTHRSEYKIAQWLDRNFQGGRAFLLGSSAFWLNAFSDVPQVAGCCMQGLIHRGSAWAHYEVGSDDGAGDRAAEVSLAWLQALGVTLIAVNGPNSTDAYHDYHHVLKFDGVLRERWRDGGDVIYEVPQRGGLVHVVERNELVQHYPASLIDINALRPYIAAIQNPDRPRMDARWVSPSHATFSAILKPVHFISVQVAYHPGWRAEANGVRAPIHADALGFIAIEPSCAGPCRVSLIFDGGTELLAMRLLQGLTIALIALAAIRRRKWLQISTNPVGES